RALPPARSRAARALAAADPERLLRHDLLRRARPAYRALAPGRAAGARERAAVRGGRRDLDRAGAAAPGDRARRGGHAGAGARVRGDSGRWRAPRAARARARVRAAPAGPRRVSRTLR